MMFYKSSSNNAAELRRERCFAASLRGDRDALVDALRPPPPDSLSCCVRPAEAVGATLSNLTNDVGENLLHAAAASGNTELVKELLGDIASSPLPITDPSLVNLRLQTALHVACANGRGPNAIAILRHGAHNPTRAADVNARDILEECALDYAADSRLWDAVAALCVHGARPNACRRFYPFSLTSTAGALGSAGAPGAGAPKDGRGLLSGLQEGARAVVVRTQAARFAVASQDRASASATVAEALPTVEAVLAHREAAIGRVALALGVGADVAEAQLTQHRYDEARLLAAWRPGPRAAAQRPPRGIGAFPLLAAAAAGGSAGAGGEAGGASGGAAGGGTAGEEMAVAFAERDEECLVCFEQLDPCGGPQGVIGGRLRLPCRHAVCAACWAAQARARCDLGDAAKGVPCPAGFCGRYATPAQLAPLLPADLWDRLRRLTADAFVSQAALTRWCPRPGCGAVVVLHGGDAGNGDGWGGNGGAGPSRVAGASADFALEAAAGGRALNTGCASCQHRFCWGCGAAPHEPAGCAQARNWMALGQAAAADGVLASEEWLTQHTQPCPACGTAIQKNDGCNHITCRCGSQFCWACLGPWSSHSNATGGNYICRLAQPAGPGAGLGAGGSAGAAPGRPRKQKLRLHPQFQDSLLQAQAASAKWGAAAYERAHTVAAQMAWVVERCAEQASALDAGAGASGSAGASQVARWAAAQLHWAREIGDADVALRDSMGAVANGHLMLWHMMPGPQRTYAEDLILRIEAAAAALDAAFTLPPPPPPLAQPPPVGEQPQQRAPWTARILGSLLTGSPQLQRYVSRPPPPPPPPLPRSAEAAAFFRAAALFERRAAIAAVCRAARADLDRLLLSVRSGVVQSPPTHWAEGRSLGGVLANSIVTAAESMARSVWDGVRTKGKLAGALLANVINNRPIAY